MEFVGCWGLVDESKTIEEISKIMVKTFDSIKQKMFDLKIVCERKNFGSPEKDDFFFFLNKRFFKAKW